MQDELLLLEYQLLILMIVIGSVTIFLFLGEKIRISAISIELILGMILGHFLFKKDGTGIFPPIHEYGTIQGLPWLRFLGNFGFILLMFLAGLELNILFLKKYFKKSLILVICVFSITFTVGYSIGLLMSLEVSAALLLGIVFAGASIGIVFPLLHEMGLSSKRFGQILITATMILDILCILFISLIEFASVGEFNLIQFITIISIIIAFFIIILFGIGPFWRYMERRTTEVKALEWEIRITFAVIVVLAVITGFVLQIEEIVGAFLAGMIMGQSKSAHKLESKIGSIGYGFFIPIFFFNIGTQMDLYAFADPIFIGILIGFILILFVVKIGSSALSAKFMGFPWKNGIVIGLLLVPSLSVGIAAANVGHESLIFPPSSNLYTLLISLIVISSIIIPILTRSSANRLLPHLVTKGSIWSVHLEHDLGIFLDDFYHNVFDEVKVSALPTRQYIRIHPDTAVITILGFMERYHQMDFPVVSADNKLIGLVNFNNVKENIIKNNFTGKAQSIMSEEELIYLTPDESLGSAINKMRRHQIELLPVVEPKTLEFLKNVTEDDILRYVRIHALGSTISPDDKDKLSIPKERVWKVEN